VGSLVPGPRSSAGIQPVCGINATAMLAVPALR